ncbi:MAG: Transcriptional regulator, XRE family [Candidatus Giovannonibacteria bacterium GW2011_GWC2_44_9]|uniref:Transcriptional regulator, XRE family n=3 Tax=Candidatus Giovannoniibacteriota TaxID=1752738 RepID=A0A0G1IYD6_9BACT|nr:MAG: Transcriptional regulator, XRE family [Candidatus Giovannonibacteria bacterium GW2011_GWB1_44_23]KKT64008.1 MAG: Transcriptional regulator, XRE family [Candidatus Giovannonibacteria bacterium GW2011_GWA1_44_29]KKT82868.1 MAG: Transcriptional regulator, XRE family [Candidatus Giovannonibacteria bacterium GW2011_GWC2_44_9]KKT91855.1 MAG: Transcriptional regulator, XRE family [Parcubacteria group bacterium GW2011_GWC1_45_13]
MSKELSTIAKNIKRYRNKLGISQDKLSKLAGVTLHTLTKIESGATPDPRIETVSRIAKGLGVGVDDLIQK